MRYTAGSAAKVTGTGAPYLHDGLHLDFRFDSAREHYIKLANGAPTKAAFATLFAFTGDNLSYYRGPAGLLVPSATNTPRIEYANDGQLRGLLIEGTRTNVWVRSREISNASWSKVRATASADTVAGPDGVASADTITEDSSASTTHFVRQDLTATSGVAYAESVFFKPKERNHAQLQFGNDSATFAGETLFCHVEAGTSGLVEPGFGSPTLYGIAAYANDWFRPWLGATALATSTGVMRVYMADTTTAIYTGNGTSGIYADFAQLEVGKFPSSPIPTTTAAVARASETCIRTISTEWSATAATICIRGRTPLGLSTGDQVLAQWDNTTDDERIVLLRDSSGNMRAKCITGASAVANLDLGALASDTNFRVAFRAAANDFAASLNGGAVVTDTSGAMPTAATRARLGHSVAGEHWFGHILTVDQYPTGLPNGFLTSW